uniref:Uncharacterized protein n=1 Tax=Oryza punctata TaxID=4537 RepID=A0A0E0KXP9_ORYPU
MEDKAAVDEIKEPLQSETEEETSSASESDDDEEEEEKERFCNGLASKLGMISVLFDTPSGFAIFFYDGISSMYDVWAEFAAEYVAKRVVALKEFKTFEDKLIAINHETGVSEELATMIKKYMAPQQKLAIGNNNYKDIIEKDLGTPCMCGPPMDELMWGLKIQMRLFSRQQLKRLREDAPKYKDKIFRMPCLSRARKLRFKTARVLFRLVKRAKEAYEAEQEREAASNHEIGPDGKKINPGIDPVMVNELTECDNMLSAQCKEKQHLITPALHPGLHGSKAGLKPHYTNQIMLDNGIIKNRPKENQGHQQPSLNASPRLWRTAMATKLRKHEVAPVVLGNWATSPARV